jgi:hypothetical protein
MQAVEEQSVQEVEISEEELRELYLRAAEMIVDRTPVRDVTDWLVGQGVDPSHAQKVVAKMYEGNAEESRAQGQKNIVYGALWFFGGLVITLGSYTLASNAGGGVYLVTTGALAVGGAQLLLGIYQCARS